MPCVTSLRHRSHLEACVASLSMFLYQIRRKEFVLATEELRQTSLSLGRITGKIDVEQLLDIIFRDFCIGK
jgi:tRNA modification GTPase